MPPSEFERAQNIWRGSASGNSYDSILTAYAAFSQVASALRAIVLRTFDGVCERAAASRNYSLNDPR